MKNKTIAVVGLGSIGMRHAKHLVDLGHRVCGMDVDKEKVEKLVAYGGIGTEPVELDGAVIATPTDTHFDIINSLADKKCPLFVEKPIGGRGVPTTKNVIMVGYNLRFHECVIAARRWINEGHIGKPLWGNFVVAQHNARPDYLRDGVIRNWSHEIDLALYLLGPGKSMACVIQSRTSESLADIILHHDNGAQSVVHLDYLTRPEIRQSLIVGDKGMIIFDLVNGQAWLRGIAGIIMDHITAVNDFDHNYLEEMEAFIDRIDGKKTIGCTAAEGIETFVVCNDARIQAGLL